MFQRTSCKNDTCPTRNSQNTQQTQNGMSSTMQWTVMTCRPTLGTQDMMACAGGTRVIPIHFSHLVRQSENNNTKDYDDRPRHTLEPSTHTHTHTHVASTLQHTLKKNRSLQSCTAQFCLLPVHIHCPEQQLKEGKSTISTSPLLPHHDQQRLSSVSESTQHTIASMARTKKHSPPHTLGCSQSRHLLGQLLDHQLRDGGDLWSGTRRKSGSQGGDVFSQEAGSVWWSQTVAAAWLLMLLLVSYAVPVDVLHLATAPGCCRQWV